MLSLSFLQLPVFLLFLPSGSGSRRPPIMRIRIKILTDFRWYLLSYSSRGSLSTALRIRPSVNQQDSVDSRLLVLKKKQKSKKKITSCLKCPMYPNFAIVYILASIFSNILNSVADQDPIIFCGTQNIFIRSYSGFDLPKKDI